jgi:phosphatidylglycerophosphatase C
VESTPVSGRAVTPEELITELEAHFDSQQPCVLAFDGDGTLWSGDVGEDVFRFAVTHGRLREEARAALDVEASKRGFEVFADPNASAMYLFDMYVAGRYPERDICELMTWCYAGHSLEEMRELAREALDATRHAQRLHEELRPILERARACRVRTVVISASPRASVEEATRAWGFAPEDIAASTPRIEGNRIASAMEGAVPYAAGKVAAGRALFGGARWVASFGDNVFDLEMMQEAALGVAVRPKPALEARLAEIAGVLRLNY